MRTQDGFALIEVVVSSHSSAKWEFIRIKDATNTITVLNSLKTDYKGNIYNSISDALSESIA